MRASLLPDLVFIVKGRGLKILPSFIPLAHPSPP
jgi:hypothetical protein